MKTIISVSAAPKKRMTTTKSLSPADRTKRIKELESQLKVLNKELASLTTQQNKDSDSATSKLTRAKAKELSEKGTTFLVKYTKDKKEKAFKKLPAWPGVHFDAVLYAINGTKKVQIAKATTKRNGKPLKTVIWGWNSIALRKKYLGV